MRNLIAVFSALILAHPQVFGQPPPIQPAIGGFDYGCSSSDVITVQRPYYPGIANSPTFQYSFKYIRNSNPNSKSVVFLGGGPGEWEIYNQNIVNEMHLADFNVLVVDQRGIGCNASSSTPFPDDFYRSDYSALDVLAAINQLNLQNYILYGLSYGTVIATMVASMAEQGLAPNPKAVVLEGAVGHAFSPDEYDQNVNLQWNYGKSRLSKQIVSELNKPNPFGVNEISWGIYLRGMLIDGALIPMMNESKVYVAIDNLALALNSIDPLAPPSVRDHFISDVKQYKFNIPDENKLRLNRSIQCQELSPSRYYIGYYLHHGKLVPIEQFLCPSQSLSSPYDSSQWPILAPIYYFQGRHDPSIPLTHAIYHRDHQILAHRFFVEVPAGGHPALQENLSDCSEDIWREIASPLGNLSKALNRCTLRTTLMELGSGVSTAESPAKANENRLQ